MRTMYDAVTAANIPADARMVAGYIDKIRLEPWSAADWARFPNAVKVEIVKKAGTNAGHVLDVEPGDATPAEAPGWVRMRRAAGADPTVYMNASTWPTVRQAFIDQGVAQPHYWVARYDGNPEWGAGWAALGCVAKQYKGDVAPGIDISSVADYWPGVDKEEDVAITDDDAKKIAGHIWYDPIWSGPNPDGKTRWQLNASQVLDVLNRANQAEAAKVDALIATVAALSKDPGLTVDTVRQIVTDAVKQNIQITGEVRIGPAATEGN